MASIGRKGHATERGARRTGTDGTMHQSGRALALDGPEHHPLEWEIATEHPDSLRRASSSRAFWWACLLSAPPVAAATAFLGVRMSVATPVRDIAVLCLASVAEEIVFRGALQPGLSRALGARDAPLPWITWTPYTYAFNLTGQPAISIPCARGGETMPVGLQIVGPWGRDGRVLAFAERCERILQPFNQPPVAPH